MSAEVQQDGDGVRVSLVLCTRNRAELLDPCLAAIGEQADSRWELIAVDNGSTDATEAVLRGWQSDRAGTIYVNEPTPGLGRARNAGLRHARGDIVAFVDDDCYLDPAFVSSVIAEFERHPDAGFIGGRIVLHDPADLPVTIDDSTTYRHYAPRTYVRAGSVQGANLSFRRTALERVGGFDDRMGAGTPFPCEDIDAAARVLWAGYAGVFSPLPVVRHHHRRQHVDDLRRLERSYDAGRGAYFAKFLAQRPTRRTYAWHAAKHVVGDLVRRPLASSVWRELRAGRAWIRQSEQSVNARAAGAAGS